VSSSEIARPGSRRARFTREEIARTALELADAEGFQAVTMRRLAQALEAGTMSLYHYVRTKAELVSLMDDALMGEALVSADELKGGWRSSLAAVARTTRVALVRHPWALSSLWDAQIGPNALHHFEQSLAALAGTPLDAPAKLDLLAMMDAYVFGSALQTGEARARGRAAAGDEQAVDAAIEFGLAQLRTGRFPHMVAMFGSEDPRTTRDKPSPVVTDEAGLNDQFERGLQTILDGAAIHLGLV
jgi:AcrR family transcriptional regulator